MFLAAAITAVALLTLSGCKPPSPSASNPHTPQERERFAERLNDSPTALKSLGALNIRYRARGDSRDVLEVMVGDLLDGQKEKPSVEQLTQFVPIASAYEIGFTKFVLVTTKREVEYDMAEANETFKRLEASGYNKCVQDAADGNEACVSEKLKAKGYDDGINCIAEFGNPTCQDTKRYNAQVAAANECNKAAFQARDDCHKLLQNK